MLRQNASLISLVLPRRTARDRGCCDCGCRNCQNNGKKVPTRPRHRASVGPVLGLRHGSHDDASRAYDQADTLVTNMRLDHDVRAGIHLRDPPAFMGSCPPVCPSFADSGRQYWNNRAAYGYDGISQQRIRNYPCQTACGAAADERGGN
jgi:hypothetical protein